MIVSRIFPILNRLIRYNTSFPKTQIAKIDGHFLKRYNLARVSLIAFRSMCDDIDKELDDKKRHFDYHHLVEKLKGKLCVIDVREYSEIRETGKIPGSINIPLGELKKALREMNPEEFERHYQAIKPQKEDEIVFTCKSGNRSIKALRIALELGYCRSANFTGGWTEWAENTKKEQE